MTMRGESISLGYFEYQSKEGRKYIKCADEKELLQTFIKIWVSEKWSPDIVTGWNIEFFDIPYLINRIKRILGNRYVEKLSPFGIINERVVVWKDGKEFKTYEIGGIAIIDYLPAYKKFSPNEKESYKLDFIAEVEIDEKKLDYSEYGSLDKLYRQNFKLFMDYNIHDAFLVERIEEKLHFIEQMISIAYVQRVNFEATITTVKPWDVLIHDYLMDEKNVVPPFVLADDEKTIIGGYVREPEPGMYEWVGSVDFTSLYPSLAMQYNISPDSFFNQFDFKPSLEEIISGDIAEFTEELRKRNLCMTPNGCLFSREKRGFFPSILKKYFDGRKVYKNMMKEYKKKLELDPDNIELRNLYKKYDNLQTAYKLIGNSGYGAFLNKYFRWYASYLGEAITSSGQMTTLYITDRLNKHLNKINKTENENYVIYSDTDSAYIRLDFIVKKLGLTDKKQILNVLIKAMETDIVPFINNACKDLGESLNAYEITTSVKLEKICDKAIFKGKKRYILNALYDEGVFIENPKPKATGMETVRSSTPTVARKALEHCFGIIMKEDNEKLFEFINEFRNKFNKLPFEDIGKPSGVKGLDTYFDPVTLYKSKTPIHVRASLVYNQMLQKYKLQNQYEPIVNFDKIKICYLKLPNPYHENVIAVKEDKVPEIFDITSFIDYDQQFEAVFLKPLRDLTNIIGWRVERIDTLEDVFG